MTTTDTHTARTVVSRDGTEIADWTTGTGPPLVLVHGTTADHTRWAPLLPHLEPHVTVHAIDRRGRGASGDAPAYDIAREFEDVAAVIDAVAQDTGSPVDLLGHSFGGICALGAVPLTAHVRRLVLYEPPVGPEAAASVPPPTRRRLEDLLARGEREAVLETFLREVVEMPEHELSRYRALPAWGGRVAAAHTLTRELRAVSEDRFEADRATRLAAPTLLLLGGDSPAFMRSGTRLVAEALPDARISVLDGQQHIAIDLVPEVFADRVLSFLRGHG